MVNLGNISHMQDLLDKIETYRTRHLLEETTFGMLVMHDPNLIRDLRDGRKMRLRTIAKIEDFMRRPPPKMQKKRA